MWMKTHRVIFLLLICKYCSFCRGNPLMGLKVRRAYPREFPFIVSISNKDYYNIQELERYHFCGGSLITKRHVLTAAHCVESIEKVSHAVVRIGSNDLRGTDIIEYEIARYVTYDMWTYYNGQESKYPYNDIAVIELSKCVKSNIKPALIAPDYPKSLYGKRVETAGWGSNENGQCPRYMQAVSLNVISFKKCMYNIEKATRSKKQYFFEAVYLCTLSKPHTTLGCGDSGSPLLINGNEIIAINMGTCGPKGRLPNSPTQQNIHVSVNIYRDFIRAVTKTRKSGSLCCYSDAD